MIFLTFDRHALANVMKKTSYLAHADDISQPKEANDTQNLNVQVATPQYADQIPAFDVTLTGTNEYGQIAVMKILGVEILNEGSGLSVDDIVNESQMTFVARKIIPWTPVISDGKKFGTGQVGPVGDLNTKLEQATTANLFTTEVNTGTKTPQEVLSDIIQPQ